MKLFTVSSLTLWQKNAIHSLVSECSRFESLSLTFPMEEAALYAFFQEDGQILAAAAFTEAGEDCFECSAFTRPASRGQGLFEELLKAGLSLLPEDTELLFYLEDRCRDAKKVLLSLGAEHVSDELMMECPARLLPEPYTSMPGFHKEIQENPDGISTFWFTSPFGEVFVASYETYFYLYGLEIWSENRKKGHGQALLLYALSELKKEKAVPVRLQVSADNTAALHLYEKTGFQISETLSCYLY